MPLRFFLIRALLFSLFPCSFEFKIQSPINRLIVWPQVQWSGIAGVASPYRGRTYWLQRLLQYTMLRRADISLWFGFLERLGNYPIFMKKNCSCEIHDIAANIYRNRKHFTVTVALWLFIPNLGGQTQMSKSFYLLLLMGNALIVWDVVALVSTIFKMKTKRAKPFCFDLIILKWKQVIEDSANRKLLIKENYKSENASVIIM